MLTISPINGAAPEQPVGLYAKILMESTGNGGLDSDYLETVKNILNLHKQCRSRLTISGTS
jgi:hypothetical protein